MYVCVCVCVCVRGGGGGEGRGGMAIFHFLRKNETNVGHIHDFIW